MKRMTIFGLVILVGLLGYLLYSNIFSVKNSENPKHEFSFERIFECKDNKKIRVTFKKGIATLVLSDKRTIVFDQVVSASGARYANRDESVVFWNKGQNAFLEENSKITYEDCNVVGTE